MAAQMYSLPLGKKHRYLGNIQLLVNHWLHENAMMRDAFFRLSTLVYA